MDSCINAGVDAPNHLLELDDKGIKVMLQKKLYYVPTVDDLVALEAPDLRDTGGRNSRLKLLEQAFRKAVAAGVTIVFGSGATSPAIPHGKQANQFAYYAKWGMSPVQALQTAFMPAAQMLNYDWASQIGSIDRGKFADINPPHIASSCLVRPSANRFLAPRAPAPKGGSAPTEPNGLAAPPPRRAGGRRREGTRGERAPGPVSPGGKDRPARRKRRRLDDV